MRFLNLLWRSSAGTTNKSAIVSYCSAAGGKLTTLFLSKEYGILYNPNRLKMPVGIRQKATQKVSENRQNPFAIKTEKITIFSPFLSVSRSEAK